MSRGSGAHPPQEGPSTPNSGGFQVSSGANQSRLGNPPVWEQIQSCNSRDMGFAVDRTRVPEFRRDCR